MAEFTEIQWCDGTLNLWTGCTKVSEGCRFCYAEQMRDGRFGKGEWGPKGIRTEAKSWRSTLEKISRRAKAENRRLRVFCQSMSDTFEGPETCGGVDSDNWRLISKLQDDLHEAIWTHPELDFLLLTKRPEVIHQRLTYFTRDLMNGDYPAPNLWLGTSVENQEQADQRIPHLLAIEAKVRFLSCEPLLGPVRLDRLVDDEVGANWNALEMGIDWVICGGESGKDARPMHPEWARSLRDQCQKAEVAFHFKQWGEWAPRRTDNVVWDEHLGQLLPMVIASSTDRKRVGTKLFHAYPSEREEPPGAAKSHPGRFSYFDEMNKVGKKAAGRLLDGREWNEFPEVKG